MQDNTSVFDELGNDDLSTIDTSFPILAAGLKEFTIKEATKECSDKGYQYLLFKTALVSSDALDTAGSPVNPGYPIRLMIGLTPSEKAIQEVGLEEAKKAVKKKVAQFLDAIVENRMWDPSLESYVGLNFFAKTRVSKARVDKNTGVEYGPAAEFASFVPLIP